MSVTIFAVGTAAVVTTAIVRSGSATEQVLRVRRAEQVEAEQQVDRAGRRLVRALDAVARDAHVADDRAALLRQAGLVEAEGVLAVEQRRHLEDLRDGDDAGAADAGHAHR